MPRCFLRPASRAAAKIARFRFGSSEIPRYARAFSERGVQQSLVRIERRRPASRLR